MELYREGMKGPQMSSDDIRFATQEMFRIISSVLPENIVFQPFTFLLLPDIIKPVETVTKLKKGLEQGKRHRPSKYCSG